MFKDILTHDEDLILTRLKKLAEENAAAEAGGRDALINNMMAPVYAGFDASSATLSVEYEVKPWQANMAGFLHGGVITAMMDHAAAAAIVAFTGSWAPTVNMNISFVSYGKVGDLLEAQVSFVSAGKKVFHMETLLKEKSTDRIVAKASSVFLNKAASNAL